MFVRVLLVAVVLLAEPAAASRFVGIVTEVKDGDSLMVYRPDVKRLTEIRLAGLDAPELAQPWGLQSRMALKRLVHGKPIHVQVTDRDRYGRLVAKVWHGGLHVNAAMTAGGHAWAVDRYLKDKDIRAGQAQARQHRRGLWALPPDQRLPPQTWRDRYPTGGQ